MMPSHEELLILDSENKAVSTQWLESYDHKIAIQQNHTRAFPMNIKRHKVAFDAGVIPAGGYKIFKIDRENKASKDGIQWSDQWARTSDILKAPDIMENEYLRVKINENGTFDLTDKETGKVYSNLNYYEDHGEHGNYWGNERPHNDMALNSLGANAKEFNAIPL